MPYIPTKSWKPGDRVLPEDLNHIEEGIVYATGEAEKKELPSSGSVGQVLTKTATGAKWSDLEIPEYISGTGIIIDDNIISIDETVVATKTELDTKQAKLESGQNIKTINNQSVLGTGNLEINSGKIDIIKVNSQPLPIATDKSVDISVPPIPEIVDNLTSTAIDKTLSANQGRELQSKIEALQSRGRYLSMWDATSGKPTTEPSATPYTYKTGDYYIVSLVGTTNYRPDGKEYTGTASTVVESNKVSVNDTYYFDGTNWSLLHVEGGGINWIIDPAVPTEPSWDSPLAPAAAIWGDPSSAIVDWE